MHIGHGKKQVGWLETSSTFSVRSFVFVLLFIRPSTTALVCICSLDVVHASAFVCPCAQSIRASECVRMCRATEPVCVNRCIHTHMHSSSHNLPPSLSPHSVCPQVLFPPSSLLTLLSLPCVPAVLIPSQAGRP